MQVENCVLYNSVEKTDLDRTRQMNVELQTLRGREMYVKAGLRKK
jgi:hypothetical protein